MGVAGIEVAIHPAVENPGVEICAPVAVVFADDCTNHPSCSDTATFSSDPCAFAPTGSKPMAHTTTLVRTKPVLNFTGSPSEHRRAVSIKEKSRDLQLDSDLDWGKTAATTEGRLTLPCKPPADS